MATVTAGFLPLIDQVAFFGASSRKSYGRKRSRGDLGLIRVQPSAGASALKEGAAVLESGERDREQLVAELEQLRRQVAKDDVSSRRLAVERMRAEAMAMRSSEDLLKLMGLMWEEMLNLGFEQAGISIRFVEVEGTGVQTKSRYYAITNPSKYGISWTSAFLQEMNEQVA